MTELLVKKFVKDYEDTQEINVRTSYGILSSIVGIICNVLLFAVKLAIGLILKSIAVIADAFNNLSDAASSIIGLIGIKMASKPADEEHPFGHGRMEYIAALVVAFLVIQFGFSFLKTSFGKIFNPEDISFDLIPFVFLVLSIGVKLWMAAFNKKLGKRIDSKVMLATAADSMGDVITTSATILSILVCAFAGVNIDAYAGLAVSLVVIWSGISIAKDTLEPLIGEAVDPELSAQITEMVEKYDGIEGTHDLIIHNYGPNRSMASIHAEVPRDVDIEVSHEIIDRVEREVGKKLNILLVIHMDPIEVHDGKVIETRRKIQRVLEAIDENLSFHDFRMVNGNDQINLIFDLVVPFSYTKEQKTNLLKKIRLLMKEFDSRYECVISMDQNFIGK